MATKIFDYHHFIEPNTWSLEDFQGRLVSTQSFILVVLAILLVIWRVARKTVNLPPGYIGVPILGYLPFLARHKNRFGKIVEMAKTQGKIFRINMGPTPAIWLNDWETVKENLIKKADIFSARPYTLIFRQNYKFKDIATSYGPIHKEQRRFALHQLKNYGWGRKSMDEIVMHEVEELMHKVADTGKRVVNISDMFFIPIMNVVWGIVSGKHYGHDDDHIKQFSEILKTNFKFLSASTLMNFMPKARFFPKSNYGFFLDNCKKIEKFLNKEIEEHEDTLVDGESRDFIDCYLKEIMKRTKQEQIGTPYEKERLMHTISNLFAAGVDTTGDTLCWILLYVSTWPEIQRKVQEEIDSVIGKNRFPMYEDRPHLPYTEAVICEAQRWCNTIPFGIPHAPIKTVEIDGYTVPKGSYVLLNIYGIHHDAKLWGDPENFRPERFIGADGACHKPEYFIPYSVGPRSCFGESLARVEVFLFFTCLMQKYTFSYVTGQKPPSMTPIWSVTLRPPPFSLQMDLRST